MKRDRLAPLAIAASLLSLSACSATRAVTDPIVSTASGFGRAIGLPIDEIASDAPRLPAGVEIVQTRESFRNPRTEREAIEQLRIRRQALLRRTH